MTALEVYFFVLVFYSLERLWSIASGLQSHIKSISNHLDGKLEHLSAQEAFHTQTQEQADRAIYWLFWHTMNMSILIPLKIKKQSRQRYILQDAFSTEKSEKLFDPTAPPTSREHFSVYNLLKYQKVLAGAPKRNSYGRRGRYRSIC